MFMRLIVLIAHIHRVDPTAVTLLTVQVLTAVMALILLVIAAIAHIVIIIPTLQEVISQVVIRVEVQAQQV